MKPVVGAVCFFLALTFLGTWFQTIPESAGHAAVPEDKLDAAG